MLRDSSRSSDQCSCSFRIRLSTLYYYLEKTSKSVWRVQNMMLNASRKCCATTETIHHPWFGAVGYCFDVKKAHTVLIFYRIHFITFENEVHLTLMQ